MGTQNPATVSNYWRQRRLLETDISGMSVYAPLTFGWSVFIREKYGVEIGNSGFEKKRGRNWVPCRKSEFRPVRKIFMACPENYSEKRTCVVVNRTADRQGCVGRAIPLYNLAYLD